MRRTFGSLDAAKTEARIAAIKIQEGLGCANDLRPQERDAYLAASKLLQDFDVPLFTAVDEYVKCRRRLGDLSLLGTVDEFLRRSRDVHLGAKVPDIIREFLEAKAQDMVSKGYLQHLDVRLRRFAAAFPGDILHIKSDDIDRWLRSQRVSPVTRNNILRLVKVFFSFAKTRSYLPKTEPSAAEMLSMIKTGDTTAEIFQPEEFNRILLATPAHLLGLLAIGGFAGLRAAEMQRLNWTAVDIDRRIITLRADQAKTASRRIVPISDNLAKWLHFSPREGTVVSHGEHFREAKLVARSAGLEWPRNGLRHSFISYRLALTNDVNRVALEAGNSAPIIFKHYRELVTEEAARLWFSIEPPEGWQPVQSRLNRKMPRFRRLAVGAARV